MVSFRFSLLLCAALTLLLLFACERPSSPDFQFQHTIEVPIIANRTVEFIGGANALIDTTTTDFEDLFSIDGDGLVRVVNEIDFNIGEFDDIFPEIDVSPTEIDAEIGLIEVSFTGTGSSTYENITGTSPALAPGPGQPITAGQSAEIDIELDVSDFESGIIESGGIVASFTNELGFDIALLEASLLSSGILLSGPEQITDFPAGNNQSLTFFFQSDTDISVPITIRIQVSWNAQTVTSEPGDLLVNSSDDDLLAQSVTAIIRKQEFTSEGEIEIDDNEFRFEKTSHYVEITQGTITIENMVNRIDLDIDTLKISFPGILMPPWRDQDSLVIVLRGDEKIRRLSSSSVPRETSLAGHRIKALDNLIYYNLVGITEHTEPQPDPFRTIDAGNQVEASIVIDDLVFKEVFGVVQPRTALLNDDEGNDSRLDIYNDNEAEVTELEDLEFLSKRVTNLKFYSPRLNLLYRTNIGVPSRVYAGIVGVNDDGQEMYLTSGGHDPVFSWTVQDTVQGLTSHGIDIAQNKLIAFDILPSENPHGEPVTQVITFDETNSNIGDFISNLPLEIRFIGKTIPNRDLDDGIVLDSILFDTSIDLDLPLNFGTDSPGTYKDTMSVDLGFLPDENSDTYVVKASVMMLYENRLPLDLDINLEFLDEYDQVITAFPLTEDQREFLKLKAAPINGQTRFTSGESSGLLQIELQEDQMESLYKTRNIRLSGDFMTAVKEASSEVKIRFDDYFRLSLNIDIVVNTRVN